MIVSRSMSFAQLIVLTLGFLSVNLAYSAGGKDGGGGMAVIDKHGQVRLSDFVTIDELPAQPYSEAALIKKFYSQKTNSKDLLADGIQKESLKEDGVLAILLKGDNEKEDEDPFWGKAPSLFEKESRANPVLGKFNETSYAPNVFPLIFHFHLSDAHWKDFASPSLPRAYQIPAAIYVTGAVFVNQSIVQKMSPEDRTGLAVHEAIRQFNLSENLRVPLRTEEIEMLTRFVTHRSRNTDQMKGIFEKLNASIEQDEKTQGQRLVENSATTWGAFFHSVDFAVREKNLRFNLPVLGKTDFFEVLKRLSSKKAIKDEYDEFETVRRILEYWECKENCEPLQLPSG